MWRVTRVLVPLGAVVVAVAYAYGETDAAPDYITAPVERGTIATLVQATGTVDAQITVDVSSQLSGRMADVFVNFNDLVKAGQPLAQLDQEIYVARVNEAKAALKVATATKLVQQAAVERTKLTVINARTDRRFAEALAAATQAKQSETERELERKTKLSRTGYSPERDLSQARTARDTSAADLRAALEQVQMKAEAVEIAEADERMAEANVENAEAVIEQKQAALDQAESDLKRTVLRSPIDGIIIKRDVNPGQTVAVTFEAKTLFTIANSLNSMEIHAKIDEADIGKLRAGQMVHFTVDAYPARTFAGSILQIRKASEVVQNVVTYTAVISAPNPDLLLLPGLTADLRIVVNDTGETLKIPNQALRFEPNAEDETFEKNTSTVASSFVGTTVWVIGKDGHPAPITVRVGQSDDNSTQLLDGSLTEGQPLIVGVANSHVQGRFLGIRLGS